MKTPSFKISFTLKAPPKDVFVALTDSKKIAHWSGQHGKVEAKVGGKFELFDGWVDGKVLAYEPGKTLAYTWISHDWGEGAQESVVKYTFSKTSSGTKVALKHSGFPNDKEMRSHKSGWKEFVFDPLKQYLAAH